MPQPFWNNGGAHTQKAASTIRHENNTLRSTCAGPTIRTGHHRQGKDSAGVDAALRFCASQTHSSEQRSRQQQNLVNKSNQPTTPLMTQFRQGRAFGALDFLPYPGKAAGLASAECQSPRSQDSPLCRGTGPAAYRTPYRARPS